MSSILTQEQINMVVESMAYYLDTSKGEHVKTIDNKAIYMFPDATDANNFANLIDDLYQTQSSISVGLLTNSTYIQFTI